jgi:hypothetical protein
LLAPHRIEILRPEVLPASVHAGVLARLRRNVKPAKSILILGEGDF